MAMAQNQVSLLYLQCNSVLKYQTRVFEFYRQVRETFFPFSQKNADENEKENQPGKSQFMTNLINRSCTRNIKNMTYDNNATRNNHNSIEGLYNLPQM